MKILNLLEARRFHEHPTQIKKTGMRAFHNYAELPREEIKDLYVSFTKLDKIGVNPQSDDITPNGIYAYPLSYALDVKLNVPYQGHQPHAWIFRSVGRELVINDRNSPYSGFDEDLQKYIDYINSINPTYLKMYSHKFDYTNKSAAQLYEIIKRTFDIPQQMTNAQRRRIINGKSYANHTLDFAKVLHKILGYDAVIDNGTSSIHSSEPTQAVFFHIKAIEVIEKILNRPKKVTDYEGTDIRKVINQIVKRPDHIVIGQESLKKFNKINFGVIDFSDKNDIKYYIYYTNGERIFRNDGSIDTALERLGYVFISDLKLIGYEKLKNFLELPKIIEKLNKLSPVVKRDIRISIEDAFGKQIDFGNQGP